MLQIGFSIQKKMFVRLVFWSYQLQNLLFKVWNLTGLVFVGVTIFAKKIPAGLFTHLKAQGGKSKDKKKESSL